MNGVGKEEKKRETCPWSRAAACKMYVKCLGDLFLKGTSPCDHCNAVFDLRWTCRGGARRLLSARRLERRQTERKGYHGNPMNSPLLL